MARGVPTVARNARTFSMTTGEVPEKCTASGIAARTSTHAATVLQIVALSGAAISAAVEIGRVAVNGDTPSESRALGFGLLTVAATKPAMNGGVTSTPNSVSKTSAGVSRIRNRKPSSNGRSRIIFLIKF